MDTTTYHTGVEVSCGQVSDGQDDSQMPAAPTPENALPKIRTYTELAAPHMTEPASKINTAPSKEYSESGRGKQTASRHQHNEGLRSSTTALTRRIDAQQLSKDEQEGSFC